MWWTPDGERMLKGAEAALLREALGTLVDMVRDDDEGLWQFAAPPFDALQPNLKLALLAQVGAALLREEQPMPKLTAVLEAARCCEKAQHEGLGPQYRSVHLAAPPAAQDWILLSQSQQIAMDRISSGVWSAK